MKKKKALLDRWGAKGGIHCLATWATPDASRQKQLATEVAMEAERHIPMNPRMDPAQG